MDDSYVAEGSLLANFGSEGALQTDSGPVIESYLKFDLRALAGHSVSGATLRMWVTNPSSGPNAIKDVSSNAWTESGITFANRPAKGAAITAFTPNVAGAWKEVEITSAVAGKAGSFMSIAIDTASTDAYHFNSAEAATNPVHLLIALDGAVRPTPAVAAPDDLPSTGGMPETGGYWLWLLIGGAAVLILSGLVVLRSGMDGTGAQLPPHAPRMLAPTAAPSPNRGSGIALLLLAGVVAICAMVLVVARGDTRR